MLYPHKIPSWFTGVFDDYLWQGSSNGKKLFLTFDDGPIPHVTPWVLETLEKKEVKATFFLVGDNVVKNPSVGKEVWAAGHQIGNHTQHHLKGWRTSTDKYLADVVRAQETIKEGIGVTPTLFRPPYGRIKSSQAKLIRPNLRIVMWSVLTGDFDRTLAPEKCLHNTLASLHPGAIVVFHDSVKAEPRLRRALPDFIQFSLDEGFTFHTL